MNQDSEKNDRSTRQNRDGSRSMGRRDDAPRFNRSQDGDRPRFSRGNDRQDNRDDKPRFSRERSQNPTPRDNERGNRNDGRFNDRRRDERPARFDRDDKPRFDRGRRDDSDERRPRFDRDATDRPARGPRDDKRFSPKRAGDTGNRRFDERDENRRGPARFDRSNDRSGNERRFRDEQRERPRFRTESEGDRPRFDRNTRGDRNDERFGSRNNRFGNDERPRTSRFSKDADRSERPARFDRDDKPRFKRSDDGKRPDNDRPKNRFDAGEQRGKGRRAGNDEAWNRDEDSSRFTGQQRKESSDRRTGKYTQAPNYDRELSREQPSFRQKSSDDRRGKPKGSEPRPKRSDSEEHQDGPGLTRLNRYIANSGVCSRREADELIARGDISVNGKVVTEMGYKVKEGDTVKYGTKILNPERFVYVLLNKPKDYITTTEDPEDRRTVMELVADAGNFRIYPVGRLDRNTTGLLLLTNDGELADKLTHPSNNIRKIYQVEIDKPVTEEHFEAIRNGIELEDGAIKPDALSIITPDAQVIGIEIHSGRNRIVRRIFEHFGYQVTKLDRTTYAGLTKKDLPRGKWRFLEPKEVVKLKYFN
ncbi:MULTISPECIES: pseudouridine synthase [unclassified Spirosoma]|uniref:pseudouridine synthase n=1 Tax=unclassified Spirosoma TaxID=2621999 RepID=UPI00095D5153|nr:MULTISPECIES: pseudouridine synthase [unclassified Spirosoma]MBN8821657.1 pseudouridine synthase [Spirosoma sp.]OJW80846.1 MAG: RNA-binding protein [Spirosoma sp. 48-14]